MDIFTEISEAMPLWERREQRRYRFRGTLRLSPTTLALLANECRERTAAEALYVHGMDVDGSALPTASIAAEVSRMFATDDGIEYDYRMAR